MPLGSGVVLWPWPPELTTWLEAALLLPEFLLLPVRALLSAFIDNPYALTAIQLLDGIGAGLLGVVTLLMIADLSRGTGRFNLLQGVVYSAIGLMAALSSIGAGYVVKNFGYAVGFCTLAGMGALATIFYWLLVPETKDIELASPAGPGVALETQEA